jgi:hypothetical protein
VKKHLVKVAEMRKGIADLQQAGIALLGIAYRKKE